MYRRRLPHIDAPGVPVFVTWTLHGALPPERVFHREHLVSEEAFAAWDGLLDSARCGPKFLAQPAVASMLVSKLREYELDSFVVMPNHVHILCTPAGSLAGLIHRIKGSTAREANLMLGSTGRRFWQEEYFDRQVRSERERTRVRAYIESNPVLASLAPAPEAYPWSSAFCRTPPERR
jgi:hypothetical protein